MMPLSDWRSVVDKQLRLVAAHPVVGPQMPGKMQLFALTMRRQQRRAQGTVHGPKGNGLQPPAIFPRQDTTDVILANNIGLHQLDRGQRHTRFPMRAAIRPGLLQRLDQLWRGTAWCQQ